MTFSVSVEASVVGYRLLFRSHHFKGGSVLELMVIGGSLALVVLLRLQQPASIIVLYQMQKKQILPFLLLACNWYLGLREGEDLVGIRAIRAVAL